MFRKPLASACRTRRTFSSISNVLAGSAEDDKAATAALQELRQAAAGLELYAPALAPDLIHRALRVFERLVRERDGGWRDLRAELVAECE